MGGTSETRGLIWFIWSIWSVWFNQTNETNQTNQSNQPVFALLAPRSVALAEFFSILQTGYVV